MKNNTLQDKLNNVIISGHAELKQIHKIKDKDIDEVIDILVSSADTIPNVMLTNILLNIGSSMTPLALAIFFARADNQILKDNKDIIYNILDELNPERLLYTIEFLKSKYFGKGLGSKYQKMIRDIMESWDEATLIEVVNIQPYSLYDLLNIIHPKYSGERGKIIKEFLITIKEMR